MTEPVAWMELYFGEPNNLAWTDAELKDSGDVYKTIPLYTHPAKTLTDEEILQLWKEFDDNDADNWFIEIARAILRKANEKWKPKKLN